MNGYWFGRFLGTNSGDMLSEIDDRGNCFEGCIYAFDSNPQLASVLATLRTENKSKVFRATVPLIPIDTRNGVELDRGRLESQNIAMPRRAEIEVEQKESEINLTWKTDINTFGTAKLSRSQANQPSTLAPLPIRSWTQFKKYVCGLEHYRYVFRGQFAPYRLRTPFHRTGRGDMRRFFWEDVALLHRHLSARTTHVFNLSDGYQNAAFLNLAQHHGYPTSLLDWTYSPFVAAYFAFRQNGDRASHKPKKAHKVRIYLFDRIQWHADFEQVLATTVRWRHFSIIEPIAIGNERLIPQQAISSYTTIDDIESYITSKETPEKKYLHVIDLPLSERDQVVNELNMMGVTAGSLFPGLDGACEELKQRFFKNA
jgi:hypothetical protein